MVSFYATCPICDKKLLFESHDDYWSCRDSLTSQDCPYNRCVTRERALAYVLFSLFPKSTIKSMVIYEASPAPRGISLWLKENCPYYVATGYFLDKPFGTYVGNLRNEDLENLTLEDGVVDIWLHLDVLEHLFEPFTALNEIYRTLKPDGVCIFTAPTYPELTQSKQVAFKRKDGSIETLGEPEYHGNPLNPKEGSLLTWRYGYDLPLLIQRNTYFKDVEVRRFQSMNIAVCGIMTEVYVCRKS